MSAACSAARGHRTSPRCQQLTPSGLPRWLPSFGVPAPVPPKRLNLLSDPHTLGAVRSGVMSLGILCFLYIIVPFLGLGEDHIPSRSLCPDRCLKVPPRNWCNQFGGSGAPIASEFIGLH